MKNTAALISVLLLLVSCSQQINLPRYDNYIALVSDNRICIQWNVRRNNEAFYGMYSASLGSIETRVMTEKNTEYIVDFKANTYKGNKEISGSIPVTTTTRRTEIRFRIRDGALGWDVSNKD